MLRELRRLVVVRVQVAGKVQGQKNQDGNADANREITPILTVRPNWKTPDERNNYHYRENE